MAKYVKRKNNNNNRQKGGDTRKNRGDDPMKNRGDSKSSVHGNRKITGKVSREILTKKIGKAQKGKKHKKIKAIDPFYHGDRKNIYDKKKMLNKAPKKEDDDYMPGKLKEILRLKEELKKRKQKKPEPEKSEQTPAEPNTKRTHITVPSFWPKPERRQAAETDGRPNEDENNDNPMYIPEGQKEGESAVSYLRRANRDLSDVFEKTMLFKKFGINFTDMNTGKMEKLYGMNDKKRMRLKEIAKAKKQRKLEKQNDNHTGFDHLKDDVEFGEVAMAPPDKLAKPRKADPSKLLQPGKKELLLKEMVGQKSATPTEKTPTEKTPTKSSKAPTKKDKYSLKKTVKLKYLPPVKQVMLNEERERVVQLYREMKKNSKNKNE